MERFIMKYKNRSLIAFHAILISLLMISGSYAQQAGLDPIDVERTGTSGWQFLKINVDARMAGMGGAYSAVSHGDVGSVFGNPAALVDVKSFDVAFYNISYVADINYYAAAIAKNVEGIGLFALSVNSLDMGDIPRTINSVIPGEGRTEHVITGETFTGGDRSGIRCCIAGHDFFVATSLDLIGRHRPGEYRSVCILPDLRPILPIRCTENQYGWRQ